MAEPRGIGWNELCLRAENLAVLAKVLGIHESCDDDVTAARRVLDFVGIVEYVDDGGVFSSDKIELPREEFDRFCRGIGLRAAQIIASPPSIPPPKTLEPLDELRALLNGTASKIIQRKYVMSDGLHRIELVIQGTVLGVGVHKREGQALRLAAQNALKNTTALDRVRGVSRK